MTHREINASFPPARGEPDYTEAILSAHENLSPHSLVHAICVAVGDLLEKELATLARSSNEYLRQIIANEYVVNYRLDRSRSKQRTNLSKQWRGRQGIFTYLCDSLYDHRFDTGWTDDLLSAISDELTESLANTFHLVIKFDKPIVTVHTGEVEYIDISIRVREQRPVGVGDGVFQVLGLDAVNSSSSPKSTARSEGDVPTTDLGAIEDNSETTIRFYLKAAIESLMLSLQIQREPVFDFDFLRRIILVKIECCCRAENCLPQISTTLIKQDIFTGI